MQKTIEATRKFAELESAIELIDPDDKILWLNMKNTKVLLLAIDYSKTNIMHEWSEERYVGETVESTAMKNAAALGQLKMLEQIEEFVLETLGGRE